MKNLLFTGVLCLICTANLISQTTEPNPLSFNWGSYTAPFHDSSHKITKPVLGWQWGANDSSFDSYIGANMTHGGGAPNPHYIGTKNGMRTIFEFTKHTHGGHRYDAEITTRLKNDFRPYHYDSSGAIFGWLWRNTSISQLDTSTPNKPLGKVKINGSGLVLKNMSPNRGYGRYKLNETPIGGQRWYLSVHLRRTDSLNTDTTNSPALSLRIKYWGRRLDNPPHDPKIDIPIIFDSIPRVPTWHTRGYWNGKCSVPSDTTDSILITRKMLPLHGISGHTPDVTLSSYFRLTDWNKDTTQLNPITSLRTNIYGFGSDAEDLAELNYHIDSLSVEVTGFGFPVSVDFIRLEDTDHRKLMIGEYDISVHDSVQKFIDSLRIYAPQVMLQGISPSIELRWWSLTAYRYIAQLMNGYAFSNPAENIYTHLNHAIKHKYDWIFPRVPNINYARVAAPWLRQVSGQVGCGGIIPAMGYHYGYMVAPGNPIGAWDNWGDTTKSFYETCIMRGANHEYLARPQMIELDTMNHQTFLNTIHEPLSFQSLIDYQNSVQTVSYGEREGVYYSDKPWWAQKQLHTIYHIAQSDTCSSPSWNVYYQQSSRPYSAEEMRYIMWTDIIQGTKGFMIDNGGFYPLIFTGLDTNGNPMYANGYGGYMTLRKIQNKFTAYDPDSPYDSDYYVDGDSTGFAPYLNKTRVAQAWGVTPDKIYLGTKSARLSVKNAFDFMNNNDDEIMRLRLVSYLSKGYKSFYSGDTAAMGQLIRYKVNTSQTGFTTRPLERKYLGNAWYEPKDSTFYEVSILRDKDDIQKDFDSIFYVGIVNRRTDPLRMLRTPISDTTQPKLMRFFSTAEYIDSCKVSPDSLLWRNEQWTQHGTREITIPFRSQYHHGSYSLLLIQEMGGTLDTVIGSDRSLSLRMLPGEGKILRIRPIKTDTSINGILAHSNQRKLISFPIPVYDSTLSKYVLSTDSVRYYLCYFRPVSDSNKRTEVCYRSSKTATFNTPSANVEWENEIVLSDSYIHPTRTIVNDTCAYPSILVQYDTNSAQIHVFVVYGCMGYMPPPGTQERYQRIVQSYILPVDTGAIITSRVLVDNVYSHDLTEYGTPMIAGTERFRYGGVFYTWADKKQGIGVGWSPTGYPFMTTSNYIRFHEDTSACPTVWKAQHPSLSTYMPVRQYGRDCALAWQENYSCSDNRTEIFTTRLKSTTVGMGDYIFHYLGADFENAGNYGYFNADSSIYCLSNNKPPLKDTVRLGNTFVKPWRELSLRDTCSIVPLSSASRIRMDAFVWQQQRPSMMFSPPTYTRLLLGGLVHPDTLIGGTVTPIRTSVLTKTILSHFPLGDLYYPTISQGTANNVSDSYSLNAEGCLNSSITSLVINAIETNELFGGGFAPHYIHQELSHTPFAYVAPQKDIAGTTFGSYIHLAGMTFAHAPTNSWEHRRVYNHRPNYYAPTALPQILASAHYFYKQGDDVVKRTYLGWNDADGSVSVTLPEINSIPLQWNVRSDRRSPYMIPNDTLFTEWFRINDLTSMKQWIKTEGWDALQVYIQKKGEEPQRLPLTIRKSTDGRGTKHQTDFMNGENEEYRLLFSRGTETAYLERTIITEPDNDGLEKATIQTIDLQQLPKGNTELSIYPNPASDEITVTWKGGKAMVQLLDMKGNVLITHTIQSILTLPTEELTNGLYMIRLQQGINSITKSFMVLK